MAAVHARLLALLLAFFAVTWSVAARASAGDGLRDGVHASRVDVSLAYAEIDGGVAPLDDRRGEPSRPFAHARSDRDLLRRPPLVQPQGSEYLERSASTRISLARGTLSSTSPGTH